ncbi:MAG: type II toxin-antitoxin system RelE/ParE family toxin [Bacteroidota bacterium]|nr:type II toxin-antitoxin system RelE/ParE family toxin [Bacteroidota bacterium]
MIEVTSFHELAELELNEAVEYYESQVKGLGIAFLIEVERSTNLIQQNPEASPRILKVIRRKILRRFPYSILYSIVDHSIRILAIANQKRRPFYWRGRK